MTSSDETTMDEGGHLTHAGLAGKVLRATPDGRGLRIGIAAGIFNGGITNRLLHGALTTLIACGVDRADLTVAWAPGAYELPLLAQRFATTGFDAVIALGAVIRGDTPHFDYVAGECARGLQEVSLATGRPVIFGVLTVDTIGQALERATDGPANKGAEAASTALEMVRLLRDPHFG